MMIVNRFEIWLVSLDPTQGTEIAKTRPCLVISPDSANKYLNTVLVAPLTHTRKGFPTRINCQFANQDGQIALDQIRAVDKVTRLVKKVGNLDDFTCEQVCKILEEMFKY
jgi:mRNA interferase MazF